MPDQIPCGRYLEKRIGEHSGRQNLPESWKWQKRWFVMTDAKGMLYYFKTADDPPNYRGVINLRYGRRRQSKLDQPWSCCRSLRTQGCN